MDADVIAVSDPPQTIALAEGHREIALELGASIIVNGLRMKLHNAGHVTFADGSKAIVARFEVSLPAAGETPAAQTAETGAEPH
jgi:phosphoribosylaminoimidazole carboxylase (NCAIR synthetase)